jgi:hypothetical protein|tara:strand:+ start:9609 stop:10250 length:642 start_codon:yes stop_codon:yes gene_type:complete
MYNLIINPGKPYLEQTENITDIIQLLNGLEKQQKEDEEYPIEVTIYDGKKDITDNMFALREIFNITPEELIEEYDFLCIYNQMMLDIMEEYGIEPYVGYYGEYGWSYGEGYIWGDGGSEFPWYEDEEGLRERMEGFTIAVDEQNGEYSTTGDSCPLCSPWRDFYKNMDNVEKLIYRKFKFNDISPIAITNHADCMYEEKALESAKRMLERLKQ